MQWNETSPFVFDAKLIETETTTPEFPNGGKAIVEQILALEEWNKSKRVVLSVRVTGKVTIWVRPFEIETYNRVGQSLWWALKSQEKNTLVDWLIKRTTSMFASKNHA